MFRRLYDWTISLSRYRYASWALAVVSFLESSVFPIPPDALLIPMCLAQRQKAFKLAFICTIASVLGGMLGYVIGLYLMETVGEWIINLYGLQEQAQAYMQSYQEYGLWIIFIAGVTPVPYKLITIASGAAHFSLLVFILSSVAARGLRFFLVAALLWKFGEPILAFIEKRLTLLSWAFLIAVVGGFVVVKYLL